MYIYISIYIYTCIYMYIYICLFLFNKTKSHWIPKSLQYSILVHTTLDKVSYTSFN